MIILPPLSQETLIIFPILVATGSFLTALLYSTRLKPYLVKKLEFELIEKNKEIANLQEKLTSAQKEIKARDEFLSIASHELKTPLTSMLLQLQSILHSINNVSLAQFSVGTMLKMLESAEQQTARLSKMINDLLNVSLITTGRLELEKDQVDLSQLASEVANRFSERFKQEGIELKLDANKRVVGQWDKLRLEQALTNLISNAIKYGDKKPIEISVYNSNASGKISVKDHGMGILPEHQQKIFALFERALPQSNIKGLGVGLYITQEIVKAHGGKIHLQSKMGVGSSFTIELPQ